MFSSIESLFIDVLEDDIDLFDQLFFSQRCTDAGTGIVRADVKFFFHRRQIAVVLRILDTGRHGGRDRIHTAVLQQGDSVIDGRDALQLRIADLILYILFLDRSRLCCDLHTAQILQRPILVRILRTDQHALCARFGIFIHVVTDGKFHRLCPGRRIGQSGDRQVDLSGRQIRQHRIKIGCLDAQIDAHALCDVFRQFDIAADILILAGLGRIDELIRREIRRCTDDEHPSFLDLI